MWRHVVISLVSIIAISSCDLSSGSNVTIDSIAAAHWWPYRVGDSLVIEARGICQDQTPFLDTIIERVTGTQVVNGHTYVRHERSGSSCPEHRNTKSYRVEGSKLYVWEIGPLGYPEEHAIADFSRLFDSTARPRGIVAREKDTSLVLPSGRFDQCLIMRDDRTKYIYALGVGQLVYQYGSTFEYRLLAARIGGIPYPL